MNRSLPLSVRKAQKENSLPSAEILFLCGLITLPASLSIVVDASGQPFRVTDRGSTYIKYTKERGEKTE